MMKKLLCLLAVASTCFALPYSEGLQEIPSISINNNLKNDIASIVNTEQAYLEIIPRPLSEIKAMLAAEAPSLNQAVINKVLTSLNCATAYNIEHNKILTVIDYSKPSSEKRLWVFDLQEQKLLFHTYVSHGLNSGVLSTTYFSNKNNSKASSMGVFRTEKAYQGRHGLSLQLDGLERGLNDNASSRAVVMHGGWYVEERFIKKYGRAGRSWGCPAVPDNLTESIINTIKDESLFVVYYPSDSWFATSKFQTCERGTSLIKEVAGFTPKAESLNEDKKTREEVLFTDLHQTNKREENSAIVVMAADIYVRTFQTKAPLERMLRRQINNLEYIALSNHEFKSIATQDPLLKEAANALSEVYFVVPVIKMVRGYYATEMQIVPFGKIKEVKLNGASADKNGDVRSYTLNCERKPIVNLRTSNHFIRWLGL